MAGGRRQIRAEVVVSRNLLEALCLLAIIGKLEDRGAHIFLTCGDEAPIDSNQLFRLRKGQGMEQHCVDYGEDCGIRADSERHCEDGDKRKGGVLQQNSQSESEIVKHYFPRNRNNRTNRTNRTNVSYSSYPSYSCRNAVNGSTCAAFRAGSQQATNATVMSTEAIVITV